MTSAWKLVSVTSSKLPAIRKTLSRRCLEHYTKCSDGMAPHLLGLVRALHGADQLADVAGGASVAVAVGRGPGPRRERCRSRVGAVVGAGGRHQSAGVPPVAGATDPP